MSDINIIVPAVDRVLDIVEMLFSSEKPKSLNELSKELNIPLASLFRIMKNLESRSYVAVVDGTPARYVIGYKLIGLAMDYKNKDSQRDVIKPIMGELTKLTNQTAQYAVFSHNQFVYIEQTLSSARLNFLAQLYMPLDINTSAGAKSILANMPLEVQKKYIDNLTLGKFTVNTITKKEKLLDELEFTRIRGYGLDDEEFAMGIGCMAVPVFDGNGQCSEAIGVTGNIEEYKSEKGFNYIKKCLMETSKAITDKYKGQREFSE